MELIIGGSFQGKEAYAREAFPEIRWIRGGSASIDELLRAEGVLELEAFIRRELEDGQDVASLAGKLCRENPDVILVAQEVGCGVVPVDPSERKYREAVGRVCTTLASHSRKVTRVICGIGTVIKDA